MASFTGTTFTPEDGHAFARSYELQIESREQRGRGFFFGMEPCLFCGHGYRDHSNLELATPVDIMAQRDSDRRKAERR